MAASIPRSVVSAPTYPNNGSIDGALCYTNLTMAAGYRDGLFQEVGLGKIGELIPRHYVDASQHEPNTSSGNTSAIGEASNHLLIVQAQERIVHTQP